MDIFQTIHEIVLAQAAGQMTPQQRDLLEQLVLHNDEACRLYVRYVHETVSLRWWAERAPHSSERELAQRILIEALEDDLRAQRERRLQLMAEREKELREARERSQWLRAMVQSSEPVTPVRHIVIPRALVYGLVAGLAAMLVFAVWVMLPDPPTPSTTQPTVAALDVKLASAVDAEWSGGVRLKPGDSLPPHPLRLTRGWIELSFARGESVLVEGPATFEVLSRDRMRLDAGRITANVPQTAIGFTIDTPQSRIVDLGTEFGVLVDEQRTTQVHVFDGLVVLRPDNSSDIDQMHLRAGQARAVNPDLSVIEIAPQRDAFPRTVEDLLNVNLVVNGDFEADEPGVALSEQEWRPVRITGWQASDDRTTTLNYEQATAYRYPDPRVHRMPERRGRAYFVAMVPVQLHQSVSLGILGQEVDDGLVRFELTGWLGGFETNEDPITFSAIFLDRHGTELDRATIGPVPSSDRNNETGFMLLGTHGNVPPGTRQVRLQLDAQKSEEGMIVDGYADNLSFVLKRVNQ